MPASLMRRLGGDVIVCKPSAAGLERPNLVAQKK